MSVSIIQSAMLERELWNEDTCKHLMPTIAAIREERYDDGEGAEVIELCVPQWLTHEINQKFGVVYVKPSDSMVCETVAIAA